MFPDGETRRYLSAKMRSNMFATDRPSREASAASESRRSASIRQESISLAIADF